MTGQDRGRARPAILTPEWWRLATDRAVVRRACKYALGVGVLLITINHGDALLRGDLPPERVIRMLLTTLVPYGVSTASSVGALRERDAERQRR